MISTVTHQNGGELGKARRMNRKARIQVYGRQCFQGTVSLDATS